MKQIIQNTSLTQEDKLKDLLSNTSLNVECMEWIRCFNTDGYPRMGGNVKVHRLVFELYNKEDISGCVVRHTCDNIKCINPLHLLKGTPADNARDRDERGRTFKIITLDKIHRVIELKSTNKLSNKEIAILVGIDSRRVSDILIGKYCRITSRFLGNC